MNLKVIEKQLMGSTGIGRKSQQIRNSIGKIGLGLRI
jgi:hypothetical protein